MSNMFKRLNVNKSFYIKDDKEIFRYLSFEQFIYLIETETLYLNHFSKWEDPSETMSIIQEAGGAMDERQKLLDSNSNDENRIKYLEGIAANGIMNEKLLCGTSWTSHKENDALWRIYSPNGMGVQIKTTSYWLSESLKSSFYPNVPISGFYVIGKIKYETPLTYKGNQRYGNLLKKNKGFDHESEVRGMIFPDVNEKTGKLIVNNAIDCLYSPFPKNYIKQVTIDPRSPDWLLETAKSYCGTKGIENVVRSTLYGKTL